MYQKKKLQYASNKFGKALAGKLDRITAVKSLHESGLLNSPKKIINAGPVELLKIKNVGRKSLEIIASLLHEYGHIEGFLEMRDFSRKSH